MAALNHTFGFFEHDAGYAHMAVGRLVEGAGDYLGVDAALHVGHFLRAFVDEQDYDVCLGMVLGDGVGHIFEKQCLTCFRGSHDEAALTFADGSEHVYDAGGHVAAVTACDVELLVGEQRGEVLEGHAVADEVERTAVDAQHIGEDEIFVVLARGTHGGFHYVAGLEAELLDLCLRHVYVVGAGHVVEVART